MKIHIVVMAEMEGMAAAVRIQLVNYLETLNVEVEEGVFQNVEVVRVKMEEEEEVRVGGVVEVQIHEESMVVEEAEAHHRVHGNEGDDDDGDGDDDNVVVVGRQDDEKMNQ
ncbi:unnamed protein product [[Candida] boidinii]|nr:unnamed protein product [[Candida] boidinii]